MADKNSLSNSRGIVFASVIIAVAIIVSTAIGGYTLHKVKGYGRTISVTGAAFRPIKSNYAIWEGRVSVSSPTMEAAYDILREDFDKVVGFLDRHGFGPEDYTTKPVIIKKTYGKNRELTGFTLIQSVKAELGDVDRITKLAQDASSLIELGVMMESRPPRYLFTGLDSLKVEMIGAATKNAITRARQLAEITGRSIGSPTSARVGVFQIRAEHSQEVSARGMSDVTSINKEIVSTVHVNFLIE